MEIIFSNTSSKGNCSVIESDDGHLIIIDAGLKYKQVDKAIGYRLHKADALLITHAHKDHTLYIEEFLKSNILTVIGSKTVRELGLGYWNGLIRTFPNGTVTSRAQNNFLIKQIEMVHTNSDGTPCECYGFLILDKSTGEKILWSTDTQYIKQKFQPLEYYCIESNFFELNDYNDLNNDENDYFVKVVEQRRVQSHMSFESAVKFLKMQDLSKCKEIRLLHLSTSLSEEDKKKMKRKLRSEIRNQIKGKEVKIFV